MEEVTTYTKLEKTINHFKKWWGLYTAGVIGLSIIAMFSCSIIFDHLITLQMMNNWVGIILGLIATMASIISLFLSFYNLEREREESQKNLKVTHKLEVLLIELQSSQGEMKKIISEQAEDTKDIKARMMSNGKVSRVEPTQNISEDVSDLRQAMKSKMEQEGNE